MFLFKSTKKYYKFKGCWKMCRLLTTIPKDSLRFFSLCYDGSCKRVFLVLDLFEDMVSSCRYWKWKYHLAQIHTVFWCILKVKGWEPECSNGTFDFSTQVRAIQSHSFVHYYQYLRKHIHSQVLLQLSYGKGVFVIEIFRASTRRGLIWIYYRLCNFINNVRYCSFRYSKL